MQMALTWFMTKASDGGSTPYLAALSTAASTIAADPGLNVGGAKAPLYYVIFLSDGYPTDALTSTGSVDQGQINTAAKALTALSPGRIFMSTVYYGTINDPVASGVLSTMASVAGGQFINVNTTTTPTLNINNLIQVPSAGCQ